jgi:hypothetical protein
MRHWHALSRLGSYENANCEARNRHDDDATGSQAVTVVLTGQRKKSFPEIIGYCIDTQARVFLCPVQFVLVYSTDRFRTAVNLKPARDRGP